MELPPEITAQTELRLGERRDIREARQRKLAAKDWLAAEAPERVEKRLVRLLGSSAAELDARLLEKVFGVNNMMDVSFLELGVWVGRSVGRVVEVTASGSTRAIGTGFMVSPRLLLTNNHVVPSGQSASRRAVQFYYQVEPSGGVRPSTIWKFDPGVLFFTDKGLDFTVVALQASSGEGASGLPALGWNRLIPEEGKILVGEYANVIGHPDGDPKKVALRENRLVDILPDFLHYETDTAGGASGAPVFNDQWEVVALHHSGAARRDEQGRMLTKDGTIWSPEMGEQMIDWIANEGVRVSRIVATLEGATVETDQQRELLSEMLDLQPPPVGA